VHAVDLGEKIEWSLHDSLEARPVWLHYIYGTLAEWHGKGWSKGGLDIAFAGDVPQGAGLSSSAALEASAALAIGKCWQVELSQEQMARHCQKIEHQYAGVMCGIMDQYASIFGQVGQAILLDCRSVTHEYIPCDLGSYSFLLCNSGVSHSLASSQYNLRRQSCEAGLAMLSQQDGSIRSWRDVHLEQLAASEPAMDAITYRRCLHVIREIERVQLAAGALKKGDLITLGALMYASHEDLSKNYEVSCEELDFLVTLAKEDDAILGARMMGGGFGGCTINLIHTDKVPDFVMRAGAAYHQKYAIKLKTYAVQGGEGACLLP
jgi:galactokinase